MPPKKQKVLELDDEPRVKMEPGVEQQQQQQQQQQQAAPEAQGVVGVDSVVEALVVSNSRLCAQVDACDARAFTEFERARVLEEQLTESKARISLLEVEHKARVSVLQAESKAKDAEIAHLHSDASRHQAEINRLQLELARRDAEPSQMELHFNRLREQMASVQQQLQKQKQGQGRRRHLQPLLQQAEQ